MVDGDKKDARGRLMTALLDGVRRLEAAIAAGDFENQVLELTKSTEKAARAMVPALAGGKVLTMKGPIGAARLLARIQEPDDLLRVPVSADTDDRGFLRAGIVGMLAAPGGLGKSQALIQLAVSVATGLPWLERFEVVKPGKVLLLLGEEPQEELDRRVQRTAAMMGLLPDKAREWRLEAPRKAPDDPAARADDLARNLWAEGLAGKRLALQKVEKDQPDKTAFADELRDFLADNAGPDGWRLVVLDPLSRFAGPLAEKDNYAATALVETLEALREAPGRPAVLVAHHTNKGGLSGGTDQGAARGSSALVDGVRWVCNLELVSADDQDDAKKVDRSRVRLNPVKSNYGPGLGPMELSRGAFGFLSWLKDDDDAAPKKKPAPRAGGSRGADKAAGAEKDLGL